MLAPVPFFGRKLRGPPEFLVYLVPKACQRRVLVTWRRRCSDVARSTSRPKAALALGCSLTTGLRILFRRVTRMAWAASVPGLLTLGFLLLRGARPWLSGLLSSGPPWFRVGVWRVLGFTFLASLSPFLAGACGLCVWVRVVPLSRLFSLGFAVPCVWMQVAGFVLGCVRVRVPPVFRLSWPGLAVGVLIRAGT